MMMDLYTDLVELFPLHSGKKNMYAGFIALLEPKKTVGNRIKREYLSLLRIKIKP